MIFGIEAQPEKIKLRPSTKVEINNRARKRLLSIIAPSYLWSRPTDAQFHRCSPKVKTTCREEKATLGIIMTPCNEDIAVSLVRIPHFCSQIPHPVQKRARTGRDASETHWGCWRIVSCARATILSARISTSLFFPCSVYLETSLPPLKTRTSAVTSSFRH